MYNPSVHAPAVKPLTPDSSRGFGGSRAAPRKTTTTVLRSLLFLVLVAALTTTAFAEEKQLWAKSIIGRKAPAFVVEKWLGSEPKREGKWVLIDFWATWCGPCRKAVGHLNGFHSKFGDKLVVIGVSDEKEEVVRKMATPKIEYASAIDTQGRMKKELAVTGIPHVIIVDPQGIVRWEGFPFLNGHELTEKVIADLLAGEPK